MLISKQMVLKEEVEEYAREPPEEIPPTIPELVYIEDDQPAGTLEFFVISEDAEDTEDFLETLLDSIYPSLYLGPDESLKDKTLNFPFYYLIFRRRKLETEGLDFQAKSQKWEALLELVRTFMNKDKNKPLFNLRADIQNMKDRYDEEALDRFEREYKKKVEKFVTVTKKRTVAPREEFDKLPSNAIFSEPQTIKAFISYSYSTVNKMDVKELFNYATVSREIPFLTCSPFYKIYNGSKVFSVWNVSEPDSLTGYVRIKEDEERVDSYSQFQLTDTIIRIESFDKNRIEESGKQILRALRTMFPIIDIEVEEDDEKQEKIVEEELYVDTYFPSMDLHLGLFKHFICTHPVFKNFYFIDESIYLVKKKTYLLLTYFATPTTPISLFISNRFMEDQTVVDTVTLEPNRCHIRLYIRRCNRKNLYSIIEDMSRCLLLFQKERAKMEAEFLTLFSEQMVNDFYKKECLIKVRADQEEKDEFNLLWKDVLKQKRTFRHNPTVIEMVDQDQYLINPEDTKEPEKYINSDKSKKQVLYYPSKDDEVKMPQRFYTCNHDEFQFIGLTEHKVEGVSLPYIPNCFEASQTEKASKLMRYLSGEEQLKGAVSSYVIKTGKQLLHKQVGTMLESVDKWVSFFYPSHRLFRYGSVDYLNKETPRFGVDKKYRSSSILYLLEYYIRGNLPNQVNIEAIRKRLVDRVRTQNVYLTDTFRYSKQELEDILVNNQFIDPRLFYHLLKDEYGCEIFMFTKDEKKSKTPFYLTCSYYHNEYVDIEIGQIDKFIMIAINKGGEFDPSDFPICEIVADKEVEITLSNVEVTKYNYPISHPYYTHFRKAIVDLYGQKILFHPFRSQPVAQTLNTFGKVSWLHFNNPSQKRIAVRLYVPIHSLELPIEPANSYTSDEKQVEEFLEVESDSIYVSDRIDSRGEKVGVYVKNSKGKIEYRYYIPYEEKQRYSFRAYQLFEKTSRMVMEYTYYLFSEFLRGKDIFPSDDLYPLYKEFSDTHFRIEPVNYKVMERRWTLKNNPMVKQNPNLTPPYQIVVPNKTVQVKLMYLLRQKFSSNPDSLMNYYKLTYMPNYYVTIADLDIQPKTVIFEKEENLAQYQMRIDQEIEDGSFELKIGQTMPYIFYRYLPELAHHTFLIQPARSLGHAVYVCDYWNKKGVNRGDQDYELDEPCTQFVWTSEYEYSVYTQKRGESRFIAVINDGTLITYQSMLPYKVI